MDLFARTLDHQGTYLETLGLTYSQAKLIWRLEVGDTLSLKELAKTLRRRSIESRRRGRPTDRAQARAEPSGHPRQARAGHPPDCGRRAAAPPPRRLHLAEPGDRRPRRRSSRISCSRSCVRSRELRLQEVLGRPDDLEPRQLVHAVGRAAARLSTHPLCGESRGRDGGDLPPLPPVRPSDRSVDGSRRPQARDDRARLG